MKLASNGGVELMLPSPRWPDSVDIKGEANFTGDTLVFKADSTVAPCQTADARYVVNRTENELHIAGWAWTPAAAGARRWWGHGLRVREPGRAGGSVLHGFSPATAV